MFENIIIGIAVLLIIWGCIFSWRLDNGNSGKKEIEENREEHQNG